jgi:hypothetical protein
MQAAVLSRRPGRRWGSQKGEGRGKAIAFTVIFVFAIFAAVKLVPPYLAEYQLADKMEELARFAIVNRYTEDQIRDHVYKEVKNLDIPVNREDIKVDASQETVKISVDYRVPVDLLVYKFELHFTPNSQDKRLI